MSTPASPERMPPVVPAASDAARTSPTGDQEKRLGKAQLVSWFWPIAIWLAVTITTLMARPPIGDIDLPIYAIAWWAWIGQSGVDYQPDAGAEWPPLLFWCIHLGWWLFG